MGHIPDINPSAGDIGSNEDLDLPGFEISESLFSVLLSSVAVDALHHNVLHGTLSRDVGGLVPTVEEDNDLKDKLKERVAI